MFLLKNHPRPQACVTAKSNQSRLYHNAGPEKGHAKTMHKTFGKLRRTKTFHWSEELTAQGASGGLKSVEKKKSGQALFYIRKEINSVDGVFSQIKGRHDCKADLRTCPNIIMLVVHLYRKVGLNFIPRKALIYMPNTVFECCGSTSFGGRSRHTGDHINHVCPIDVRSMWPNLIGRSHKSDPTQEKREERNSTQRSLFFFPLRLCRVAADAT